MSGRKDNDLSGLLDWLGPDAFEGLGEAPAEPPMTNTQKPDVRVTDEAYTIVSAYWEYLRDILAFATNLTRVSEGIDLHVTPFATTLRTEDLASHDDEERSFLSYLSKYPSRKQSKSPKAIEFRIGNIAGDDPRDRIASRLGLPDAESLRIETRLTANDDRLIKMMEGRYDPEGPSKPEILLTLFRNQDERKLLCVSSYPSELPIGGTTLVPQDFSFNHILLPVIPREFSDGAAAGLELLIDRIQPPQSSP